MSMSQTFSNLTFEYLRFRLRQTSKKDFADKNIDEFQFVKEWYKEDPKPAAVLVPLFKKGNGWHILFTRRNSEMVEHSGQVAFPGGRSAPGDKSPEDTALREAEEETGIHPRDVSLLGKLPQLITVTNYCVTPVVGAIPWPYTFYPSPEEVSRIFSIPLDWLSNTDNYEVKERRISEKYPPIPVITYKPYQGEILWGASARIVMHLLEILKLV